LSYSIEDQTTALAGVFQSAVLVHQIAHQGSCHLGAMETILRSLFITDPPSTLGVFGELSSIRLGLAEMAEILQQQTSQKDVEVLRYSLNLMQLAGQTLKRPDMLRQLSERIDRARHTADHFGYTHENIIGNLASIYLDTISTFRLRIQVTGNPNYLRIDSNAVKIRALLLGGIRAAVLWHQTGGRRWHLVFRRKRIIQTAYRLARDSNHGL